MKMKWPVSAPNFYKLIDGETIIIENKGELKEEFYEYSMKFNKSAHILTKHIIGKPDISKLDTYFFSLAYLYRHSLELMLKAIGFKYITLIDDRKIFIKDTFHNLSEIYKIISPYVKDLIACDKEGDSWLVSYFEDINQIDKESDSFRYPFGIAIEHLDYGYEKLKKYSIKIIFDEQTHIDLATFANKMEIAFKLLDTIYNENFGIYTEYKKYKPIFLEQGGSYYSQSVIGYKYSSGEFYPYVKAYTESAEYLYSRISKNKRLKDTLFIPMCYLYRNAIELAIKEILFEECSFTLQQSLRYMNNKKHKVQGLWNLVKSEIKENSDVSEDDITILNAEKYIVQLNNVDGSSDKFRYPTNKHLELYFKKRKQFDINNVNNFFGELASFLSAVNTMMSVHNEWKAEMEAEYCSAMDSYFG